MTFNGNEVLKSGKKLLNYLLYDKKNLKDTLIPNTNILPSNN